MGFGVFLCRLLGIWGGWMWGCVGTMASGLAWVAGGAGIVSCGLSEHGEAWGIMFWSLCLASALLGSMCRYRWWMRLTDMASGDALAGGLGVFVFDFVFGVFRGLCLLTVGMGVVGAFVRETLPYGGLAVVGWTGLLFVMAISGVLHRMALARWCVHEHGQGVLSALSDAVVQFVRSPTRGLLIYMGRGLAEGALWLAFALVLCGGGGVFGVVCILSGVFVVRMIEPALWDEGSRHGDG